MMTCLIFFCIVIFLIKLCFSFAFGRKLSRKQRITLTKGSLSLTTQVIVACSFINQCYLCALIVLCLLACWFLYSDKQLIQFSTCPLLAFLDGCTPLAPPDSLTENLSQPFLSQSPEEPTDLLDKALESETKTPRSSLIRLEPITEAEASETTLFYLCELNSDLPSDDTPQIDIWKLISWENRPFHFL